MSVQYVPRLTQHGKEKKARRGIWNERSTSGILDYWIIGGLHAQKDWSDRSGHGRTGWMLSGGGVMKDTADNVENDRGVLVDLYIPRHCSATSQSTPAHMYNST